MTLSGHQGLFRCLVLGSGPLKESGSECSVRSFRHIRRGQFTEIRARPHSSLGTVCSLSFRKIDFICTFTVDSVITSLRAIVLFDAPSVTFRRMASSRRDKFLTTSLGGPSPDLPDASIAGNAKEAAGTRIGWDRVAG